MYVLADAVIVLFLSILITMRKNKIRVESRLWYVRVMSMGALRNSISTGMDEVVFLPDPLRRPPQLGFRGLVL